MILNEKETSLLLAALNVCKTLNIESVMVFENKIRGAKDSLDSAIISDLDLGVPDVKIGIGRSSELLKRLGAIENPKIAVTTNDKGDATILSVEGGRTKMQFRCTASTMIQYPKANEDDPIAVLTLTAGEVKQLVKAVNTMGAQHVTVQLTRQGAVVFEAIDPATNDTLSFTLENPGELVGDEKSFVFNYLTDLLMKVISAAQTGSENITLVVGGVGSIAVDVHGHSAIVMAHLTGDEDDYDYD